ncbi:hypothetical protein COO60DRAFT_389392 [Scenedesmus sp. NREL 46B-D3]|nr:hypothetical protein COO60DRAFT_389392 [Scenedesmus sp. NREL 46B-D3]
MQICVRLGRDIHVLFIVLLLSWRSHPTMGYPELFVQRFRSDCKAQPNPDQQHGSHGTPMWDRLGVGFSISQWGRNY